MLSTGVTVVESTYSLTVMYLMFEMLDKMGDPL